MHKIITLLLIITSIKTFAQVSDGRVGINTTTPRQTLDVVGNTNANKLYLRKIEQSTSTGGSYMAVGKTDGEIKVLGNNHYLFTYIPLKFTKVTSNGITSYDTGIKHDEFVLVLHNYSITTSGGSTSVSIQNNGGTTLQSSPEFIVYKEPNKPNWYIRGRFLNSKFYNVATNSTDGHYNITMNLMAYRKIITKQVVTEQSVDVSTNNHSGIPIPIGF